MISQVSRGVTPSPFPRLLRRCRNTWLHGIRLQLKVLAQSEVLPTFPKKVVSLCVPRPSMATAKGYQAELVS